MFRITPAALGCLALLAACAPEESQRAARPAQAQASLPAEHRDTDEVYFRETASADGKFTERERKSVYYLASDNNNRHLIKISRVMNTSTRVAEVSCRLTASGFKNLAIGSYTKAWSFSDENCGAEMNGLHLMTSDSGCCAAEQVHSFYASASGKLLVKGTSLSARIGTQHSVIYDNSLQSIANASDELQGVIWLVNAERVLDRVDVTGLSEDSATPEIVPPGNIYNKTVTFKYDAAQYSLIVSDDRFEIPADSAAVFRKVPYQNR
jgi:hypothetical protein